MRHLGGYYFRGVREPDRERIGVSQTEDGKHNRKDFRPKDG